MGSVSGKLMDNPDIVSLFSVVSDGIDIQNDIKDNILEKMLELYLRVRSFYLAKDITPKQKKLHDKNKGLRKDVKKSMEQPGSGIAL